jgi:hypothetical protein
VNAEDPKHLSCRARITLSPRPRIPGPLSQPKGKLILCFPLHTRFIPLPQSGAYGDKTMRFGGAEANPLGEVAVELVPCAPI